MRMMPDGLVSDGPFDRPEAPIALVRPTTRLLAELQTSLIATGIRVFGGRIDRFVIYSLAARVTGLSDEEAAAMLPTSAHALAASLDRPYETIRRHVNALIDDGLCVRHGNRIQVTAEGLRRPRVAQLVRWTHDCFVRFVEDLQASGETLPPARTGTPYEMVTGVRAAIDIMMAVIQTNKTLYPAWTDLALCATVIAANCRDRPVSAANHADRPVAAQAVARAIGVTPATASRHLAGMVATGQLVRERNGFRVNGTWLNGPDIAAVSLASLANIRRLLGTIAAQGFPFDDPASAYLAARPPLTPIR